VARVQSGEQGEQSRTYINGDISFRSRFHSLGGGVPFY